MQTGAGGFAHRVEPGNAGACAQVGLHAAARVMRGRHNRNRLVRDVNAKLQATRQDGGKVCL